ncbi:MAG: menaquinone biosynthesis protein [Desulfomonile tiedjei]|nr:menaquinone biosynthesis protein [Desulfomonile tiedjei]
MNPIRLGRMAYINTLPVDWGLVNGGFGDLVTLRRGTPTTLNRLLAEGQLDASPVSSVAAAEHAADWLVFDHLCIGCRGDVGSVILQSDVPVEQLGGRSIAVTAESATAVRLLQILLSHHWKVEAKLVTENGRTVPRLLIGDPALKTAQSNPAGFVYDLGRAWRDYTGRGFVFGLWCVRRAFVEENPWETRMLYDLLRASRAQGLAENRKVMDEAANVTGLDAQKIESYFAKLVFDLDNELWSGLTHFLALLGHDPGSLRRFGEVGQWTGRLGVSGGL